MEAKSLGQIAYDAYGEQQGWVTFAGAQVITPPAEARAPTAASCTTHEFTTSTLACKGSIRALNVVRGH